MSTPPAHAPRRRGSRLVALAALALVLCAGLSAALAFPQVWAPSAGTGAGTASAVAAQPAPQPAAPALHRGWHDGERERGGWNDDDD